LVSFNYFIFCFEISIFIEEEDDGKRMDGVTMTPWSKGRCLVWDATCTDPLSPSYLQATILNPGSAANEAEKRKRSKYQTLPNQYLFIPCAFETTGGWGKECKSLISQIGNKISTTSGDINSTNYLKQYISIAIQRGNAISILKSIPQSVNETPMYNL
jgi:hypothetical protein